MVKKFSPVVLKKLQKKLQKKLLKKLLIFAPNTDPDFCET